jgi:hypothetical protein
VFVCPHLLAGVEIMENAIIKRDFPHFVTGPTSFIYVCLYHTFEHLRDVEGIGKKYGRKVAMR